jgi:hypothetical protein
MKEIFRDVLSMEDVKGVMLFSFEGALVYKEFKESLAEEPENRAWWGLFLDSLGEVREADFVFDQGRIYLRKTASGYLIFLLGLYAPIAMLRLNCDILLPLLKEAETTKGIGRLFKRKK